MVDLDHPCKGTCSGWKQGYERGAEDAHNQKWGCREEIEGLKEKHRLLREAALLTIARADDYADSYITRPIRDAVAAEKDAAK